MTRRILVTNALPYANGPIHLGHLLGYIQADIWVRFQRLRGHTVHYVCADDAHGTPIMLAAEKAGIAPEAFIARWQAEHAEDFATFGVAFDVYHSTHSPENQALAGDVFARLDQAGAILRRTIAQLFDPERRMFLPDRYVKGVCPNCHSPDQYGDNCEVCGKTYAATDLIEPVSVVSGATPVLAETEHLFFDLARFTDFLKSWLEEARLHSSVKAKLAEWFASPGGLRPWDISRDAPYFGFAIPGETGKFFYVWLDAPIGYMAAFEVLAKRDGLDFEAFWNAGSTAELHHFIGKDIVNFHGLFWPAVLQGSGHRVPSALHVNGYLTLNGEKMSKSRGTFITARQFAEILPPEALRYLFASRQMAAPLDADLNPLELATKINADIVGKYVNIASRCAGFVTKAGGRVAESLDQTELASLRHRAVAIADAYEANDPAAALREIMAGADAVNAYIAAHAPWSLAKSPEPGASEALAKVAGTALEAFRLLTLFLKPVLPRLTADAEMFLGTGPLAWASLDDSLAGKTIGDYRPLFTRIAGDALAALLPLPTAAVATSPPPKKPVPKTMTEQPTGTPPANAPVPNPPPAAGDSTTIGIDDFSRVELRIARIAEASLVDGADKLLRLVLDLGPLGTRQVFAGIKSAYAPETLVGRLTVCVANLAPRKMKFGLSEGMVLAASGEGSPPFLLSPDSGAEPGMRVK